MDPRDGRPLARLARRVVSSGGPGGSTAGLSVRTEPDREQLAALRASTSHGTLTSLAPQVSRAARTVTLDRRAALFDLVAHIALDQGDVQPLTGSGKLGERDLRGDVAQRFQYTAGSGPRPDTLRPMD